MKDVKCPICDRMVKDILRHYVITHHIKNRNHLKDEMGKANLRIEFGKYVDELNDKMKRGEIAAQDFRELTIKWWEEHK